MQKTYQTEGSTIINRSVSETFEFLCNPEIDRSELTPLEEKITAMEITRGVGATRRFTIEFAARELDCIARCIEFDEPHRLVMQLEGDVEGIQTWELTPTGRRTQIRLALDVVTPDWLPSYLRDDTTANRWGKVLVEQTLARVKSKIEQSKPA